MDGTAKQQILRCPFSMLETGLTMGMVGELAQGLI
jgi:hypothetical protein